MKTKKELKEPQKTLKNKAYLFRIKPNSKQRKYLNQNMRGAKFIYNKILSWVKKEFSMRKKVLKMSQELWNDTVAQLVGLDKPVEFSVEHRIVGNVNIMQKAKGITKLKKTKPYLWIDECSSMMKSWVSLYLDKAFKNFFDKNRKGGRTGFPKFKKEANRYTDSGTIKLENGLLTIPKCKNIKIIQHREIKGKIKQITIKRSSTNKYYVSILTEYLDDKITEFPPVSENTTVGIKVGLKNFCVISARDWFEEVKNNTYLEQQLKKIKRESRKFSRMKKGGKNWEKQRKKIATIHEKIANQRKDFIENLTTKIANDDRILSVKIKDLGIKDMMQNKAFARKWADVGAGMFYEKLIQKVTAKGKNIVKVFRGFASTKICNVCKNLNEDLKISQKIWECPVCKKKINRELNAAENIRDWEMIEEEVK